MLPEPEGLGKTRDLVRSGPVARPEVKIIATEPAGAALLSGKEWQPHKIQGWTPDFVPAVLNRGIADAIVLVDDVLARDTSRALAQKEGIFVGISSGATLAAALKDLAAILDLFSRRVVGWALSPNLTTELPLQALQMALLRRRPEVGRLT